MNNIKNIYAQAHRLVSLDALRGLNMLWIIGTERIAHALYRYDFPGVQFLTSQFTHSGWNGFTFYDLIFPMFLFLVGVSTVFSVESSRERGMTHHEMVHHIMKRSLGLFLIGLYISNVGLPPREWVENLRVMGVLQRIAICYCFTSLLFIYSSRRMQRIVTVALLVGYWLVLFLIPVPGYETVVLSHPGANLTNYLDKMFLPGRLYYDSWDPEGILSTFPALANCLLGGFTGYWLRMKDGLGKRSLTREHKAVLLAIAGLMILGLGLLWGTVFPINKKIWTSSFVLLTGGISALCMALFYWGIDIRGKQKWAFPLVVIGRNSIFIYVIANTIPFQNIADWVIKSNFLAWCGTAQYLMVVAMILIMEWLVLYIMYRRKIFLRL